MAIGSGVERFLDTEEVTGSNPVPPILSPHNEKGTDLFLPQTALGSILNGGLFL